MSKKTHIGSCFCGAVELSVSGEPLFMGYCHCNSCRHWSASPVTQFTLWVPDSVKITKGKDQITTYSKTENSYRQSCKICGGHILADHKPMEVIDVYPAIIPDIPFNPAIHVFYEESVLPIKDGLPKFKDLPKEAGGSGKQLSE